MRHSNTCPLKKILNDTTIRGVKFEKTLKPDNQPIPQKARLKAVHLQEVWKERNPLLYSSWLKHLRQSVKNPTDTKLYDPALLDETGNKTGTCVGTEEHRRQHAQRKAHSGTQPLDYNAYHMLMQCQRAHRKIRSD